MIPRKFSRIKAEALRELEEVKEEARAAGVLPDVEQAIERAKEGIDAGRRVEYMTPSMLSEGPGQYQPLRRSCCGTTAAEEHRVECVNFCVQPDWLTGGLKAEYDLGATITTQNSGPTRPPTEVTLSHRDYSVLLELASKGPIEAKVELSEIIQRSRFTIAQTWSAVPWRDDPPLRLREILYGHPAVRRADPEALRDLLDRLRMAVRLESAARDRIRERVHPAVERLAGEALATVVADARRQREQAEKEDRTWGVEHVSIYSSAASWEKENPGLAAMLKAVDGG